ncbi:MAG: hypothetical protein M3O28_11715 [Actinomycetota bacterium]|nr:hypothetical protein [Actinomycetota bacterium]
MSGDCDHQALNVGSATQPIVTIRNTSGHSWESTIVYVEGLDSFRLESLAMDSVERRDLGAHTYDLGPLANGTAGSLHVALTASRIGAPRLTFGVWGQSPKATDLASIVTPATSKTVSCGYVISSGY